MRKTLLFVTACLAAGLPLTAGVAVARPLVVHGHFHRHVVREARIASYLVQHGLLSPEQAACASLVPGPHGSRRVEHLSVFEHQGGRCPGTPQPPVYLFDVFVDVVSGVVDVTPETRDELDTVL